MAEPGLPAAGMLLYAVSCLPKRQQAVRLDRWIQRQLAGHIELQSAGRDRAVVPSINSLLIHLAKH